MSTHLGRLVKVDIRTLVKEGDNGLSAWLAREDNLAYLGDTLGLDLRVQLPDVSDGRFAADLVCRDAASDSWVLIDSQFEETSDHHLGRLLRHAAGHDALTMVWIAGHISGSHSRVLDWLNKSTGPSVNFFGVEFELWRIDDSAPAPRFNVVCRPSGWTRSEAPQKKEAPPPPTESSPNLEESYWTNFIAYLKETGSELTFEDPGPGLSLGFEIVRPDCKLQAFTDSEESLIGVRLMLYGPEAKEILAFLQQDRSEIEREIGARVVWREKPGQETSDVLLYKRYVNPLDQEQWRAQWAWLQHYLEAFYDAFAHRILKYELGPREPQPEPVETESEEPQLEE